MVRIERIPEMYRSGFKQLASMDDPTFNSLISALSTSGLQKSLKSLVEGIGSTVHLEKNVVFDILLSAGSLVSFAESNDLPVSDVVAQLSDRAIETEVIGLTGGLDREGFRSRLTKLLADERLYYASKAVELLSEYECTFDSARVMTDIRTVFSRTLDESPKVALVVHNLHIHCNSDASTEGKDYYLAMDSGGLRELQKALSRAMKKERTLASLLKKAGVVYLDSKDCK